MTSEPEELVTNRVLTLPNAITFARLALLPVFLWLYLTKQDWPALIVLFVLGNTDWVDGTVARRTGQVSELGKILDPISDRIAIVAVMLAITYRGLVPWWLAGAILGRELLIAAAFGLLEARGVPRIPVNRVGKLATLSIFSGMGLTVVALVVPGKVGENIQTVALVVLGVGAALYWVATGMYFIELRKRLKQRVL
jgi:cardiolipin synthase (CMP-forming)